VTEYVWTFTRGACRAEMRRQPTDDGILLVLSGDGPRRSYFFRDLQALVSFQDELEAHLVRTGWSLAAFEPERRTREERLPHLEERRRSRA
jgi:hypothetical protein